MREEYVLVLWPWVQELMEYPWFRTECYLLQGWKGQEHYESPAAYFVPTKRINDLGEETINRLF
jgi:hypothetical protein